MASFWIRPEYVVDYRPILDAPVDAAGEVVEEVMLYCCYCSSYKWGLRVRFVRVGVSVRSSPRWVGVRVGVGVGVGYT